MVRRRRAKQNEQEKHVAEQYNTRSLMEAYNSVTRHEVNEFAAEITAEGAQTEDTQTGDALDYTSAQALDSYREGTIDQRNRHNDNKN